MKNRMREGYAVDWQVRLAHLPPPTPHTQTKSSHLSQDLVSRFTLDSATEFLFGNDVRSLSAGLPYPPTSDIARTQTHRPAADEFASAFYNAQLASAKRGRFQDWWPLAEFWHDKVEAQKSTIDKFIAPILTNALQQKARNASVEEKVTDEDTLLSQLLKVTDGMSH